MNEPNDHDRSIDDLSLEDIAWPGAASPTDELRAALLARTCGIVRLRARGRRLRIAAGWLLAYAAGITTAWLAWPHKPAPVVHAEQPAGAEQSAGAGQVAMPAPPQPESVEVDLAKLSPEELRSRVMSAPRAEQIRLLSLAGDRYLFGRADVAAALDCYRQVLELTPPAELARPHRDDSWLLAELKFSAASQRARFDGE